MHRLLLLFFILLIPVLSYSQTNVKFASIGDFGSGSADELAISNLVKSWNPEFIITVGDNNYPIGAWATIDQNIGQFYRGFIHPYVGTYGPDTATINRFFPCLGNHDLYSNYGLPFYDYFTLPRNPHNNERYYDYVKGNVHFFVANSDFGGYEFQGNIWEPDGIDSNSYQAQWIKSRLAASTAKWKVVYFHHPPYMSIVSGYDSIHKKLRWPFKRWGASIVLTGHCHWYERLNVDNFPYITNGLGGEDIGYEDIGPRRDGSQFFYSDNFGAQLIQSYNDSLVFRFYNINNKLIDYYRIPCLNLRLRIYGEGGYKPQADSMLVGDTVTVSLRSSVSPFTVIDSVKGYMTPKGFCSVAFNKGQNNVAYYIVVKNKNLLETWSATGQKFTSGFLNYDFSADSTRAYGENMAIVNLSPRRYSFYSGDVTKDGIIDISDQGLIENDAALFKQGYCMSDLNGDHLVDLTDLRIVENNAAIYVEIIRP